MITHTLYVLEKPTESWILVVEKHTNLQKLQLKEAIFEFSLTKRHEIFYFEK
jgi:hypothetical protein